MKAIGVLVVLHAWNVVNESTSAKLDIIIWKQRQQSIKYNVVKFLFDSVIV